MKYRSAMVAFALCAAATMAYLVLARSPSRGLRANSARPGSASEGAEVAVADRLEASARDPRTIGENQQIGTIREAILRGAIAASQAQAAPPPVDPEVQARETLDERMANAPPNPQNTAKMEDALRAIIDSGALQGTTATFVCGASTCRVELSGAEDAMVEKATGTLAGRAPKLFAASSVYQKGSGERAVYLSTSSADLALAPPDTRPATVFYADAGPTVR